MNEGDSAGGGHQGLSPAPPAVTDRRSTIASNNSNQQIYNQGIQNRTVTSGSAVLPGNTIQQQQQQHLRYLPNEQRLGTTNNHQNQQLQQARVIVAQVHQNYTQQTTTTTAATTTTTTSGSGVSLIRNSSTNNLVSNSYLSAANTIRSSSNSENSSPVSASVVSQSQSLAAGQIIDSSNLLLPASRKRLKCELNQLQQNQQTESSSSTTVAVANTGSVAANDIGALKKRILEYKYSRLRSIKEKYSEHVAELFFLHTGGSMMDYPTWRKKPPTPQFINFTKSYRLDGYTNEEINKTNSQSQLKSVTTTTTTTSITATTNFPKGAEIKIAGVGVTPVAVSTTLPAAVVQLTQQGGTPILPDISTNIGTISEKRRTSSSTTTSTNVSNAQNANPSNGGGGGNCSGNGTPEHFSVKAKQEVYVMQRISELQREGLWTEKRLPKLQEPARPKAHWDYLLEEMVWLAADFAQERKWKKSAAKKCARMVQKYFQDKASAAQKAEKAQELHLKRVAAFIAKEVKMFWSNVEKLVEYKHHTKLEEKRKKALDQHLSFIVDQTEKFSQQLAEGMNKTAMDTSAAPSVNSSRISSPKPKNFSDDEFCPTNEMSDDDEETIAKAEAEAADVNEEVVALQKESEMELDDFLKELPKDYLENRDKIVLDSSSDDASGDEEFEANENSADDEDTIMEQENTEKNVDHKKELAELNAENEMSLDELLAKYKGSNKPGIAPDKVEKMEIDSDDDEDDENDESDSNDTSVDSDEESSDDELMQSTSEAEGDSNVGLKSLLLDDNKDPQSQEDKDHLINDAAAIAESIQPKGNTLSSTDVVTPVPFLLKHTLREYQHIGLDWLVTMHDRKLNGILADEMGLGKTIQTISLLAHLACVNENWGPHLIVVPSSVMLNWEMEFKKWCPGFKILTYYGTQKERKQKRIGWTKFNAFHVCITSYKLVIQDQQSFRRKKWKYLILDEAQNIKNFKSQRWQLLLNFQTEQRLLLTGTPLQNNLMELWSLMHFLMPHVFQSHREFKEWFSNPMTGMIEGNSEYNDSIIKRLHKVLRPFLLRRLKSEVEKQMPKKYEHVVMCRLSKRQRYLYDDFMSRAKTRETLAGGNLLSVINVLMQLRKVCNHPNLFEVRPTTSPFRMEGISFRTASLVCNMLDYNPFEHIDLNSLSLMLVQLEQCLTAYVSHRVKKLATSKKLIEEIDVMPEPAPKCPAGKYKFHIRIKDTRVHENLISHSGVKVGTSPTMKTEGNKLVPVITVDKKQPSISQSTYNKLPIISTINNSALSSISSKSATALNQKRNQSDLVHTNRVPIATNIGSSPVVNTTQHITQIVQMGGGRHIVLTPGTSTVVTQSGQRITVVSKAANHPIQTKTTTVPVTAKSFSQNIVTTSSSYSNNSNNGNQHLVVALAQQMKANSLPTSNAKSKDFVQSNIDPELYFVEREQIKKDRRRNKLQLLAKTNQRRCDGTPIYGEDLRSSMQEFSKPNQNLEYTTWHARSHTNCMNAMLKRDNWSLSNLMKSYENRTTEMIDITSNYVLFVPAVSAPHPHLHVSHLHPSKVSENKMRDYVIRNVLSPKLTLLHPVISAMNTQFPDPRLIQYDCGKLQTLDRLLRKLKYEGHRVLIFTQMTKMLDVLESFLNYHGHIYLRLDGTTRIDQRQILMERFNGDKRIFAFILSTRSGGVGVNLTGADTVIFYDSDWNPTMDAQAQDRCHRIGQTRDVHIYRLVSDKTIEENILKKANQKRLLGDLAIEGGNFTTAYFKSTTIQDLFQVEAEEDANIRLSDVLERDRDRRQRLQDNLQEGTSSTVTTTITTVTSTPGGSGGVNEEKSALGAFESALAAAEDEQDVEAATTAKAEAAADLAEFDETIPLEEGAVEKPPEMSKADQELQNLVKQLSPIERYAMRFVEETGGAWTAEQLRAAEAEIEQQKREWEANRLAALQKEEEMRKAEEENDDYLTYSREDAKNQVNKKLKSNPKTTNKQLAFAAKQQNSKMKNNRIGINKRKGRTIKSTNIKRRKILLRNLKPKLAASSATTNSNDRKKQNTAKRKLVQSPRKTKITSNRKILRSHNSVKKAIQSSSNQASDDDGNDKGNDDNTSVSHSIQKSEDFSECSLDVMVDSNDATTNSTNCNARNDDDTTTALEESTEEDESDDSEESAFVSSVKKQIVENHIDVNSPRTRSRGSVKINLWTLDVSPILPGVRPIAASKSSRKTDNSSEANKSRNDTTTNNCEHSKSDDESQSEKILNSTIKTPKVPPPPKELNYLTNYGLITPKLRRTIKKVTPKSNGGKNHTLDSWLSKSPKLPKVAVVLSKSDMSVDSSTPKRRQSTTTFRMTRRTSMLKLNPENGPS